MTVTIKRSGKTNQFIVELRDGIDTIRCAVHIEGGASKPDADLEPAAIAKAVVLASSLRAAFTTSGTVHGARLCQEQTMGGSGEVDNKAEALFAHLWEHGRRDS